MADLSVKLGDITLQNPLVTASGTFGYAKEYEDILPLNEIGAITVKGVAPFASHGNPTPRTAEVFGGMLNAIGLQGPGVKKFINSPDYLPFLRTLSCPIFVNIWGKTIDDYVEMAQRLDEEREGIAALEINISCPNVKEGGIAFGTELNAMSEVISAVREATTLPLITKLSPNVTKIGDFAQCAVKAGSDIISLINTLPGMAIDIERRTLKIANGTGGLSGPAIKPIGVRMVHEVSKAVDVPIIGMGGVSCVEDVIEYMIAGADAVGIGTALFSDPMCLLRIPQELSTWLDAHGFKSVTELTDNLN